MPIRFPSHVQTPAERHDFLLCLQERLRRFNNARVRQIAREWGIEAAVRWHRSWFRPRNTAVCQALLSLRPVLYPKPQFDEAGQVVVPWRVRKLKVRSLRDDATEMLEADPAVIETEDADPAIADPTEDFTTYTEQDPNDRLSITANTITVTGLTRNEDAYVYDDKGADHFGATFEHLLDTQCSSSTEPYAASVCWAVSNLVDDAQYWWANQSQAADVYWYNNPLEMIIVETEAQVSDTSVGLSADTRYYLAVERTGETALECRIYSDSARTTLVDTITVSLPSGRRYRYVFAVNSYNTGGGFGDRAASGDVRNLDLQEGAPPTGVAPQFMHLARMRRI